VISEISTQPHLSGVIAVLKPIHVALLLAAFLSGCVSAPTAVPGSDKVRMTKNPNDVSGCTAVGNIKIPDQTPNVDVEARNQTIGFGGNVALVTASALFGTIPTEGVAYRCPQ
jgi:starvation-inducible outer membrane lipoprotein